MRTRLGAVDESERRFVSTVADLDEADLAGASLCPGWTRGHVIAHVALNAHSLVNLMIWARTAEEVPQYVGPEERDADIEMFSSRTKAEHLEALAEAAGAFQDAARSVPLDRWEFPVRGIGGNFQPVSNYLHGRINEVEIHNVDLALGYDSDDWPEEFIVRLLRHVPERLGAGVAEPFAVEAEDLSLRLSVGEGEPVCRVWGPAHALLKWCLGRSDGAGLSCERDELPAVPSWG